MSQNSFKSIFNLRLPRVPRLIIRAFVASSLLIFMTVAAAPRLGAADVPELPTGDGTGDVPDMFVKMVPSTTGVVTSRTESIRLSSLRGRVALLDMFWSQCPHCEDHAPHIVELYNRYRQRGFTVLGLATDKPEEIEKVKAFMRKTKINYPVGFLTTEIVAYYADAKDRGVPQMILFGADGKMAKRLIGWKDEISKELINNIEAQLAKLPTVKPGSKASSKSISDKVKQG
jgi:glutathione peroxidase-family protein